MTLALIYQNKINKLVDVIIIVNTKNLDEHHIFYDVQVHASGVVFKVQAIINTGTIYNLIAQDLIKEHDIPGDNKMLSLMVTDTGKLHLYK